MASRSYQRASSLLRPPGTYGVFLTFCGQDMGKSFADHLNSAVKKEGINVFVGDEKLERGRDIRAVVITSENHAFSRQWVMKLTEIVECTGEKQVKVLPVFYYVNPSDSGKPKNIFAEAFASHGENPEIGVEQREKWRAALREVSDLAGRQVHDGYSLSLSCQSQESSPL